eukprot:CAMPEP_0179070200 /NCGR_PEP_ID=MMETSP0796-20121207/30898_1 /TAXON_ID=73915 /ORGANISM="Pyrodinium bahamense, Strain pbaha01" /LENGTH=231 /DNA_ID=CAMNT_0020767285 /DNA_START=611 /DNA_END=1303 /DNA_ORIENTATION=-
MSRMRGDLCAVRVQSLVEENYTVVIVVASIGGGILLVLLTFLCRVLCRMRRRAIEEAETKRIARMMKRQSLRASRSKMTAEGGARTSDDIARALSASEAESQAAGMDESDQQSSESRERGAESGDSSGSSSGSGSSGSSGSGSRCKISVRKASGMDEERSSEQEVACDRSSKWREGLVELEGGIKQRGKAAVRAAPEEPDYVMGCLDMLTGKCDGRRSILTGHLSAVVSEG